MVNKSGSNSKKEKATDRSASTYNSCCLDGQFNDASCHVNDADA